MQTNLEKLYNVYCNIYDDQLEAAEEDYQEYMESEYQPPESPWTDEAEAKSAMESLISECFISCDDVIELLERCGLDEELRDAFGITV